MKNYYEEDQKLFQAVAGFKAGNQECYYTMYELSIKYIYKIVYDIIKEHHATEDLVQETYLTIYNKIASLEEVSKFYAWAGRIATNHTFRYIQKNKRELLTLDSEDGAAEFAFEVATQDNEEFIPENVLMDKEKQRLIARIIDGLSTEQKLAVQYFYYEEMSVTEIAETMGCAKGTIMSRLNYARKAIKAAVVDLAENQGTKLYSLGSLPLFYIVFRSSLESFAVASAASVSGILSEVGSATESAITKGTTAMETAETAGSAGGAVSTTAGTEAVAGAGATTGAGAVGGSVAGAGSAAGVGTGTAVGTGAVAKAAAAGATKGILGKIGASLGAKIAAGVLTAGLLTTGGIMLHNAVTGDDSEKSDTKITVENESSVIVKNEESKSEEGTTQEVTLEISEVGQIIEFGHYEQDGDVSNGTEPIEWEVLSVEDGRALLISKYVLDAVPFSSAYHHMSWENSFLRMWLNEEFLQTAFSEEEQKMIPMVTLTNPGNNYFITAPEVDTQDQIFVLSVEEVFRYYDFFYVDGSYGLSEEVMAKPTAYAMEKGIQVSEITEGSYEQWLKEWPEDIIGKSGTKWWLRTTGSGARACYISREMAGDGCCGNNIIDGQPDGCQGGVRPALYVDLVIDSTENEEPEENPTEELEPTPESVPEPTAKPLPPISSLTDDYVIDWMDPNLEEVMRERTRIYDRDIVYGDVKEITVLNLDRQEISDITALYYLTSLTDLWLSEQIDIDISGLSNLTNLTKLRLNSNRISDITALTGLTNLVELRLYDNSISDISALSNLTNLEHLELGKNNISDISALGNLTSLKVLELSSNNISDISTLGNLTGLEVLILSNNSINDISALNNFVNLKSLDWCNNGISDISALSNLTSLTHLYLNDNNISDISVLSNLTSLEYLYLSGNNISDYSPVSHVPNVN